jgi:hypothetical protein
MDTKKSSKSKNVGRRKTPTSRSNKKQQTLKALEKIRGIGEGIWNEDAQEYVNRLRDNDRF